MSTAELSTLRAVTFRLSSSPTIQLPLQVPAIAASLVNCRTLLSSAYVSGSKTSSEASVAVHKYRTLLSTLLQDRTIQGRWTAIVLIKATIEVGGWETLQKSLPWVRGLLGVLTKPDPPSTKKLCLITLTRIFVLTRDYPTLIREITTPSLSSYIQSCLQMTSLNPPSSLLQTILESFNQLLPRHPTIFRQFMRQLQQLLGQLIAPTPSSKLSREQVPASRARVSSEVSEAAQRLYVQLPCCAPKGASSDDWEKAVKNVVANVHRIAGKVFRAVLEDWQQTQGHALAINGHTLEDEVQDLEKDPMDLPPWSGIYAGGERLIGLLEVVEECLTNPTSIAVNLQLGLILDLVTRMLSLTVPSSRNSSSVPRFNNQVSKEERENLWVILPQVHVATIKIVLALLDRCEINASAIDVVVLDLLAGVFGEEKDDAQIRAGCYSATTRLLTRTGPALPKSSVDLLSTMIRKCCDDILPPDSTSIPVKQPPAKGNGAIRQQASTNADSFLNSALTSRDTVTEFAGLQYAACMLLPVLLTSIRPQHLSDSLRTRMHRTAILTKHKDAMIASVLNPPQTKKFGKPAASILPLLARAFADAPEVESILRPRMPVVRIGGHDGLSSYDNSEDIVEDMEEDDDHFVGEELDTLLETATQTEPAGGDIMTEDQNIDDVHQHHVPSPVAFAPVEKIEENVAAVEPMQISGSNKRAQNEDPPLSPTKRVKVDVTEEEQSARTITIPTTVKGQSADTSNTPAVVSQSLATVTQSNLAPPMEANSDDNDDFGELVLGQDTDEESDS